MDQFIADLTCYTHRLKERRLPFGGVTLCYSTNQDDGVLRCDRHLRTHWTNFAQALTSFDDYCDHQTASSIDSDALTKKEEGWWLSNVELNIDLKEILEPVLTARNNLRTLILDRNEFGRDDDDYDYDGVIFLCNLVESNSYLKRLSFHNNTMENIVGISRLCDAVAKHSSLEHLTLENVGLGDDEYKLSMIMNAAKNLECLGLAGNNIGSRGAAAVITEFLATNNDTTKIVYLRDNLFGDESAHLFATSLRKNKHLRVVDFGGNRFSQIGRMTIRNALFDTSSLNAAVESNHKAVVYIDESGLKDRLGVINCKGTPEDNRQRKVFPTLYATADGTRLGQLLNDVPVGLMPKLLAYLQEFYLGDISRGMKKHAMESLQQYNMVDFEEAFSRQTIITIVFEVLRSWNLPTLYENI